MGEIAILLLKSVRAMLKFNTGGQHMCTCMHLECALVS